MRRKRRGRDFWERVIAEHQASGESQRVFAARRQLSLSTLQRWARQLRQENAAKAKRRAAAKPKRPAGIRFVEVKAPTAVAAGDRRSPEVEVALPGGVQLRFSAGGDRASRRGAAAVLGGWRSRGHRGAHRPGGGEGAMLMLPPSVKIFLATKPTDMRKGHDGLCALVKRDHGDAVFSGHLFVFVSRRGDRCKILAWHRGGFVLVDRGLRMTHLERPRSPTTSCGSRDSVAV
jgi:hypothetical protein